MRIRMGWFATATVAVAACLGGLGLAKAQTPVTPSSQLATSQAGGSVASATATTTMVPQDQIFYETVFDTEFIQVPTTQMQTQYRTQYKTQSVPVTRVVTEQVPTTQVQTQYRTDYRTQTVPVTRTVTEQVPTTQMQTQYRTEYRLQTVPVTRTITEQVPTTQMQTQYQTEYKTRTVPVTRVVVDQVPITQMQTQYKTEYKTRTVPVTRSVAEVVNVPRTYTVYVPRSKRSTRRSEDDSRADHADAEADAIRHGDENGAPDSVSAEDRDIHDLASKRLTLPETYTESVPVTSFSQVVEERGGYQTIVHPGDSGGARRGRLWIWGRRRCGGGSVGPRQARRRLRQRLFGQRLRWRPFWLRRGSFQRRNGRRLCHGRLHDQDLLLFSASLRFAPVVQQVPQTSYVQPARARGCAQFKTSCRCRRVEPRWCRSPSTCRSPSKSLRSTTWRSRSWCPSKSPKPSPSPPRFRSRNSENRDRAHHAISPGDRERHRAIR